MSDIVVIAVITALPPTLMALAALIATIKGNNKLDKVEAKVDGNLAKLLDAFTTVAQTPKTIIVEGRREADKPNGGTSVGNKKD